MKEAWDWDNRQCLAIKLLLNTILWHYGELVLQNAVLSLFVYMLIWLAPSARLLARMPVDFESQI